MSTWDIANHPDYPDNPPVMTHTCTSIQTTMELIKITPTDLIVAIGKLHNNKSP